MRLIFVIFLIGLSSCNWESVLPDPASTVIDVKSQRGWRTTALDNAYKIQFPRGYQGGIGPTIEGPEFSLKRYDQQAYFLGIMPFFGGGMPLPNPQPATIPHGNVLLDRFVTFQRNGQTQGLFYYAQQPKALGRLYLLHNGTLGYSMIVQYDYSLHQEVLGILQTIQPH
ncbi:hypothetical protein M0L20_00655 [Spirosoma sp. RP8]|uniref:Uncharacterized protein n=1 Tax=Spirosoma liriopis TaxID=2937440 RepID=A0ABT0HDV3_9BACT|nr:hypothetical protein [Spirosoma liriopis]MCK8490336.1 hypothetical protein [Spirosoma liriopis]